MGNCLKGNSERNIRKSRADLTQELEKTKLKLDEMSKRLEIYERDVLHIYNTTVIRMFKFMTGNWKQPYRKYYYNERIKS